MRVCPSSARKALARLAALTILSPVCWGQESVDALEKTCGAEADSATRSEACYRLALRYRDGVGVEKDAAREKALLAKACYAGGQGCFTACLAGVNVCPAVQNSYVVPPLRELLNEPDPARRRLLVASSGQVQFLWEIIGRSKSYDEVAALPDYQELRVVAQARLVEIARSDPDPWNRASAIGDVHVAIPTELLRHAAKNDPDERVRKMAARRLAAELALPWRSDSAAKAAELQQMAKSPDPEMRSAAVRRLEDVALLSQIAQKDKDAGVRADAVDKLGERADEVQPLLVRIAEKDKDESVRSAAAGLVRDPKALERLLRTSGDAEVRRHAIEGLAEQPVDPSLMLWVAEHDGDDEIRQEAASRIVDQRVLARLATTSSSSEVRTTATRKLTDQKLLGEIAVRDPDDWVYVTAIKALTDEAVLLDIVRRRRDEHVLELVARQTKSQAVLVEILRVSKATMPRGVATAKLTDRALLTQLLNDRDPVVRNAATKRLKEQF